MSEKQPEKVQYAIKLCAGDACSKKKVKASPKTEFKLVGILAVAMKVGEKVKIVIPLTELETDDFKNLANEYGIPLESIEGYVSEIKEETRGEHVIKFE